jgi:hypothetical protein
VLSGLCRHPPAKAAAMTTVIKMRKGERSMRVQCDSAVAKIVFFKVERIPFAWSLT